MTRNNTPVRSGDILLPYTNPLKYSGEYSYYWASTVHPDDEHAYRLNIGYTTNPFNDSLYHVGNSLRCLAS